MDRTCCLVENVPSQPIIGDYWVIEERLSISLHTETFHNSD